MVWYKDFQIWLDIKTLVYVFLYIISYIIIISSTYSVLPYPSLAFPRPRAARPRKDSTKCPLLATYKGRLQRPFKGGERDRPRSWSGKKWARKIGRVELDLAETIQIVTFWRLVPNENIIFEPLKVWIQAPALHRVPRGAPWVLRRGSRIYWTSPYLYLYYLFIYLLSCSSSS